jgi:hypothetical protein
MACFSEIRVSAENLDFPHGISWETVMGMLFAFAPFIVFVVLDHLVGPAGALTAGSAVSAALIMRDLVRLDRDPRILEVGTFFLFGVLAMFVLVQGDANVSIIGVRLGVDAGLLAIVLVSMAMGRPFTLQYAKENVAPDVWKTPAFRRMNYIISGAWAVAFALIVAAEAALLFDPRMSHRVGILLIVAALVGAFKFTAWYPAHRRTA